MSETEAQDLPEGAVQHIEELWKLKAAVTRAVEILREIYPARIAQKKATEQGAKTHVDWLLTAADALDRADRGEDIRRELRAGPTP